MFVLSRFLRPAPFAIKPPKFLKKYRRELVRLSSYAADKPAVVELFSAVSVKILPTASDTGPGTQGRGAIKIHFPKTNAGHIVLGRTHGRGNEGVETDGGMFGACYYKRTKRLNPRTCVLGFVASSVGVVQRERERRPILDRLAELRGLPSLSVLMRSRFTGWYDLSRPRARQ